MIRSRILLFIFSLIVWIFLDGSLDIENISVGILASILVSIVAGSLFASRINLFFHPQRYFWFFVYLCVFFWECLKANIDVALRVIHPFIPLSPGIVKVRTSLKSNIALTFLANSITLTPGTLTVDIDKEKGFLYVHWISVRTQNIEEATEKIVKRFERILRKVFE